MLHRIFALFFLIFFSFTSTVPFAYAEAPVSRRDAFITIWKSIARPVEKTKETPYTDTPLTSKGGDIITFAKKRGILSDDQTKFYPDVPVSPFDALRWMLRTRSVEAKNSDGSTNFMKLAEPSDVSMFISQHALPVSMEASTITQEDLLELLRAVDNILREEVHEVSLYAEKFQGKGTSFGEAFNMYALTAAHRTFPANTLVKVTNIENGKSVTVRINDRGPFIQGRDLDLSLASFTTIADRSKGKIMATFERLGDSTLVSQCKSDRYQVRVTRFVKLNPGIPHTLPLGARLRITSSKPFVVRDILYPDGTRTARSDQWITGDEVFDFAPSTEGEYEFLIGDAAGSRRVMRMKVVACSL